MPTPCDTILLAAFVVTQDTERRVIENGAVAVAQGHIAAVGPRAEVTAAYAPAETIEVPRGILLPGLINAHTHASMSILRGLADDLPLMDWLNNHIFPVEQHLTKTIVELGALLSCCEMLASGTTCFNDMYLMEQSVAKAVEKARIRAVLGEVVFAFPSPAYKDVDAAFALVRSFHADYADSERIRVAVMPHAVYTTTPELLTLSMELAEELNAPWQIHLAETPAETAQCIESFKERPVAYLDGLGILNERCLLAHCVDLTEEEIALLGERACKVAHNPESNMKLASGVAPVAALRAAGATVGLGTDGAASNNDLSLFSEMASCALLHKVQAMDATALPAQDVLDMATRDGAEALLAPELGRIEVGAPADLTVLDGTRPNLLPCHNPVSQAVYAATGGEVCLTMVGGEVLYRDGTFPHLDYDGLLREIVTVRDWVENARSGGCN